MDVINCLTCTRTFVTDLPSSETQGQIVGARESLNGRKNMAWKKVKNGEKSPWGQCLTRPVPNDRRRSASWLVPEKLCVFLPNQEAERRRPFGTGLVRHCPQGLFSPFFTFLRVIFFRPFRLSLVPTICPWVSEDADLPKYEEFVVVYEKPGEARTHLLLGENVLMQCLGYNICKSMLFLKGLLILWVA